MKRFFLVGGMALLALSGIAQEKKDAPSGTPAVLEAITGKKARVLLKGVENGKVVFSPYKSTREMKVPASKIKNFTFFLKYDADGVVSNYLSADYDAVIATLEPILKPYEPFMVVDNNLRDAYLKLLDSYLEVGDMVQLEKGSRILLASGDPQLVERGKVDQILVEIAKGNLIDAEAMRENLSSESAKLYLKAILLRKEKNPKEAIKTVVKVIADYGNDMDWLPQTELLCAYLYLDMGMTNSAYLTAKQVEHIYAGTRIAGDAKKFRAPLKFVVEKTDEEKVDKEDASAEEEVETEAAESEVSESTNQTVAAESSQTEEM